MYICIIIHMPTSSYVYSHCHSASRFLYTGGEDSICRKRIVCAVYICILIYVHTISHAYSRYLPASASRFHYAGGEDRICRAQNECVVYMYTHTYTHELTCIFALSLNYAGGMDRI